MFEALSGHESRTQQREAPKFTFKIPIEHLLDTRSASDLKVLMGFFLQRAGRYEAFLFTDPSDCSVEGQGIGTGNGSATQFQLIRNYGNFDDPIHNLNGEPLIYLDGVLQASGYTVSDTGLVEFASAPGSGVGISWTGNYYYRVRFLEDGYDFSQFSQDFFECADMGFIGSVRNLV